MAKPIMTTEVVQVTPALAEEWLKFNVSNRDEKRDSIKHYAEAMTEGRWIPQGHGIQFGTSGRLLDGQNRLKACVKAGVPFWTNVHRNVADDAFTVIDSGAKRNGADVMTIMGYEDSHALSALAGQVRAYELGTMNRTGSTTVDNQVRSDMLRRYPTLPESLQFTTGAKLFNRNVLAFIHFVGSRINRTTTEKFLNDVMVGANLDTSSPAFAYRDKLLTFKETRHKGSVYTRAGYQIAIGLKALNLELTGRPVTPYALVWRSNERFPVPAEDTLFGSVRKSTEE